MADMKTLTLGGKTFNIMDAEARAKAIPTVQVGGDTLTWDGNTEGKVSVILVGGVSFYKVDDAAPVLDDCQNGLSAVFGGEAASFTYDDLSSAAEEFGTLGTEMFLSIPYDNFSVVDTVFPEKGTYFVAIDGAYVSSLTIPGYTGFGEKKIDPAYLYQPDWDQNDETAADFIKNRPFGDVETVLFEEQTIHFGENGFAGIVLVSQPQSGDNLTVELNGAAYPCTVVGLDSMAIIGNAAIFGIGDDTGEPFAMIAVDGGADFQTTIGAESATLKITGIAIKKIPPKYYDMQTVFFIGTDRYLYTDVALSVKATSSQLLKANGEGLVVVSRSGFYTPAVFISRYTEYAVAVIIFNYNLETDTPQYVSYYTAEYVPPTT